MPTISQLPVAQTVAASDTIPISQGGSAHAVSLGTLLASTQPAILIGQGSLLGRTSLGPGGPEEIAIGTGLMLNSSTLQTKPFDVTALTSAANLVPTNSVVVTDGSSVPQLLELNQLRGLFSAGSNVSISTSGVVSASGNGITGLSSIGTLPSTTTAAPQELLGISQSGTDHAITYANLINGQTIDKAQPAGPVSDSDSFWVAQDGNAMTSQTFGAVWPWIASKLVSFKLPVTEITVNTTLDGTVHNARVLVCSQAVTLTPVAANMGSGFQCDIINLSSGSVSFAGSVITSTGASLLAPGQAATVRCVTYSGGSVVYVAMGGGGGGQAVPGTVTAILSISQTINSVSLAWTAPASGGSVSGYTVEYRPTGSSSWTVVSQSVTTSSYTVSGLSPTTSYDFCVIATNAAGSGVSSAIFTASTLSAGNTPDMVGNITAGNATSSSMQLTWQAPSTGAAPTSYTVQYRVAGSSSWTGSISGVSTTAQIISGLVANTSYDFAVIAVNANGSGPLSAVVTASTAAQTGAVTTLVWNVAPSGSYMHGTGVIGVNAHVTPANAPVQFGFSASATVAPSSWTAGGFVNTNLWGAYVPTPATAGAWYAWVTGTDGSSPTVYATAFTVT